MNAAEFCKVDFCYAGADALLSGFDHAFPSEQVCAVLGPNGSGKTTLLLLLLGLLKPQTGTVRIQGDDQLCRRLVVSLVPQSEVLLFDLSVLDYVLLGRAPHLRLFARPGDGDCDKALKALEMTGMAHLAAKPVTRLSGGEVQLVMLSRALAQETPIILLDEPTSHLDPANRRRVLDVMRELKTKGRTVLFTTHDPQAAAETADHVTLLRAGRIQAAGPVSETMNGASLSAAYGIRVKSHLIDGRLIILT